NVLDAGAGLVARNDVVENDPLSGRPIVVAVNFIDRELQLAVLAGKAEVALVAGKLGFLHRLVWSAVFVAGVDQIARVNHSARRADDATAGRFGNGGAGKAIERVD